MKTIALIPARLESQRFPNKLIKKLAGVPIIARTYIAALNTKLFDEVYVVSGNDEIIELIKSMNGLTFKSRKIHQSGTDRIAEAANEIDHDIVVNLQGDEPFINIDSIDNSSTKVLHGGNQKKEGDYKDGFFYEPTLLSGVPVESPVCQEEIFGPVACAIPFKSFDEVLKSANNTPFGLSAVLWTQNLSRALQFVEEIEAGFVQVNQCVAPRANVSYGGLKMSGLGKEYAFDSMINHFTQSKTVLINRGKSIIDK